MQQFPGFEIRATLYVGQRTLVYRAWDLERRRLVILKCLRAPTPDELGRLEREFQLGREVGAAALPEVLAMVQHGQAHALVFEDFGATSLSALLKDGPLDLPTALRVAMGAARSLAALHAREIVHKDVTPSNVLFNPDSGDVRLCDLGLATRIPRTTQGLCNPNFLEGTLAYISPEQTGRMNRTIDYRTDFYSLGATLYELIAGRPPFALDDPIALVHAHTARTPELLHKALPAVPEVVSDLVLRLMAKNAESRYQSASGIVADLQRCLDQWAETGTIESFPLGADDRSAVLCVSQKLYGRERESETLREAFERTSEGGSGLLLVRGYSGIGKSMLVNEVHRPMVARRGLFIDGKYDQLGRSTPLSAFKQALEQLIAQLLTESEEQLAGWKQKLQVALGDNGHVLLDFLPSAALVLGEQPAVIELPPSEARERFDRTLIAFIQAFAAPAHPLVLFLDDLQWVDRASLRLLEGLLADENSASLLVIGAYRDNEVPPSHPLMGTLTALGEQGVAIETITLSPLDETDTIALVADSLERGTDEVAPLGGLIHQKTGGNPFFSVQFLRCVSENGALALDAETGQWEWDLADIARMQAIETAVELMLSRIEGYGEQTKGLLQLAGCMGNRFDLETLSIISSASPREVSRALWEPVRDGLVLPLDEAWQYYHWLGQEHEDAPPAEGVRYRFAHDRVQEAALISIPETERAELSLRIGRLLLARCDAEEREERVFDLVKHLSLGADLFTTRQERDELAGLCLKAGRKALASTAYAPARDYLVQGAELLGADGWERDFELMFALHRELIEVEFVLGNLERAREVFDVARERSQTLLHLGDIYQLMIRIHLTADEIAEGLRLGREVLMRFDLELPTDQAAAEAMMEAERVRISELVGERPIASLVNEPEMTDARLATCLGLLHETWTCAIMAGDFLQVMHTAVKITRLSLEHGYTRFSACGFVAHAAVQSLTGHYAEAKDFGLLSMEVCHRFEDVFIIPKVHNTFANFTNHWVHHLRSNVRVYEESYQSCLQSGDRWWGAWAVVWIRTARMIAGDPIDDMIRVGDQFHPYVEASGYQPLVWLSRLERQILLNLAGRTDGCDSFDGEGWTEAEIKTALTDMGFGFGLYVLHLYKAFCLLLHDHADEAPEQIEKALAHRDHIPGLMPYADWWFYAALVWMRSEVEPERVAEHLEQMQTWTEVCPENFEHRLLLMQAELARVKGEPAGDLYGRAISTAQRDGYLQHEALANELAARYYLDRERERAAIGYLLAAHDLYRRWGANTKVRLLEEQFPELRGRQGRTRGTISASETTTNEISLETMDLMAMLRAAQVISAELQLDVLLRQLLTIGVQSAGAQKGVLVVVRDGQPQVAAMATPEEVQVGVWTPLEESDLVPRSMVQYVLRSNDTLVLDDASNDKRFGKDAYIVRLCVRSALAVPSFNKGEGVGVLYLENNLTSSAFTPERVQPLQLLSTQAAIALDNAMLYDTLERKVAERTLQLAEKNAMLEEKNAEILRAQSQLVHSEKMASLGQLVAGVAHEMNNPISFIHSGLPSLRRDLGKLMARLPESDTDPKLAKVQTRIGRLLDAMGDGTRRVTEIISNLRTFSRLDEAEFKQADLCEALDATLVLLHNKMRDRIEVVREYGEIPHVECFVSQLNQVFMNLLANAADAIQGKGKITIRTDRLDEDRISIDITDTGCGMSEEVQNNIFDPFYTTKDVGEGTGLGLSISHGVIDKHKGTIEVHSAPGEGTRFRIVLPVRAARGVTEG